MSIPLLDSPLPLNPFPGLRPFEPDEDYLFFGRERQTDELLKKLRTTRFLSILGRSGSGKSSLVRSGMIPTLYGGGMTKAGSQWRVAIMRPGEDPIGNLAAALSAPEAIGPAAGDEGMTRAFYETTLRASQRGIIECIKQARLAEGENVLVLVDQFEELFRYKASRRLAGRDEAVAFVKLLLTARAGRVPAYICVTMRSDFVGDSMEFGDLPESINAGLFLVPRMTRDELKSAIAGPVAVGGGTIAPRLVSRLLNDLGDDPDQLPILQHALMRTWERWEIEHEPGEPLDLHHYEAIGTMHSALSRHAEEAFDELTPPQQRIAETMFKALTDRGTDVRGVRRPAPVSEICALTGATLEEIVPVAETFRRAGRSFLMPPESVPLHETSILDISHESLMRVWTRLSDWADDEAKSAQLYLNVAADAERHERGVAALWRDPELQLALTWREKESPTAAWAARYDPSFERAMAFLDESREERDREVHEREARRRRELRRARALVVVFAAAAVVMMGLGGYALQARQRAEGEAARANRALTQVQQEQTRTKAEKKRAEEQRTIAEQQRGIAVQQKQVADQQRRNAEHQTQVAVQQTAIARNERQRAETQQKKAETNERTAREQTAIARSERTRAESEQVRAEAAAKEAARLGEVEHARALALDVAKSNNGSEESVRQAMTAYRLNRDNRGPEDDPDIFNALLSVLTKVQPLPVIRGENDSVRALAVAPDGRSAITGSEDGRVMRLPLEGNARPATLATFATPVRAVAIRAAGDVAAAATEGGEVRLFDLRQPGTPRALADGLGALTSLAFDPSGSRLAAGNRAGTVMLWDLGGNAPPVTLSGKSGNAVTALAFDARGKSLAAALGSGGAVQWDLAKTNAAPAPACSGDVRSVAWRPDGVLACGSAKGTIHLQAGGTPELAGHRSAVNSLSFDRGGSLLASASSDGTVRIWHGRGAQPIVLAGHQSWIWSAAFTPDGRHVVSAGQDRTVRIWPARADVAAEALCGYVNAHLKNRNGVCE